jgi:hypothetical protein
MQVGHTNELEGGRRHYSIGRIRASCSWRAFNAHRGEADRLVAVQALIREAQEYDADAIIGLDFEVDGVKRADFDSTQLQRVAATGVAVKFAEVNAHPKNRARVVAHLGQRLLDGVLV